MQKREEKDIWTRLKRLVLIYFVINLFTFSITMPVAYYYHSVAETKLTMSKICVAMEEKQLAGNYWIESVNHEIRALQTWNILCTTLVVTLPMVPRNNELIGRYHAGIEECQQAISVSN